jgi:hypothetical protein
MMVGFYFGSFHYMSGHSIHQRRLYDFVLEERETNLRIHQEET